MRQLFKVTFHSTTMTFIAGDLINPTIEKTKKLIFPFKWKLWIKIAILSMLVGLSTPAVSGNVFRGGRELLDFISAHLTLVISVGIGVIILSILLSYFGSVFQFCLLDSITKKKVEMLGYFNKNTDKGFSLWGLRWIMTLIFLVLVAVISLPIITRTLTGTFSLDSMNLAYLILAGMIFVLLVIIFSIINSFLNLFAIYYMYLKNKGAWHSLQQVVAIFKREYKEMLIFWLLNIGIGIIYTLAIILAIIVAFIALAIVGGILFAIGLLIYLVANVMLIPLIILAVPLGMILFLAFVLMLAAVSVPFVVFLVNWKIDFMKRLLH
jgi:hypothetical protein